jgi:hypothetical protein
MSNPTEYLLLRISCNYYSNILILMLSLSLDDVAMSVVGVTGLKKVSVAMHALNTFS